MGVVVPWKGFAPRFETTRNWAQRLVGFIPGGLDYAQDQARDRFTGAALLEKAAWPPSAKCCCRHCSTPPRSSPLWLPPCRRAAQRVAGAAARRGWPGGEGSALRYEAAVARLALEWVAASHHATDVLFTPPCAPRSTPSSCCRVFSPMRWPPACAPPGAKPPGAAVVAGGLPPLGEGWGEGGSPHYRPAPGAGRRGRSPARRRLRHRTCAGRLHPGGLASTDRALVRRITALLRGAGIAQDENGWTLSTTRAAAWVMTLLRAAAWDARSDAVLD